MPPSRCSMPRLRVSPAGAGVKAARAAAAEVAAIKAAARTPAQIATVESQVAKLGRKEVARGFVRAAGVARRQRNRAHGDWRTARGTTES